MTKDLSNDLWKNIPTWARFAIVAPTTTIALFLVFTLAWGQTTKLDSIEKTVTEHRIEDSVLSKQLVDNQARIAAALEKLTCALLATTDEQRRRCADIR